MINTFNRMGRFSYYCTYQVLDSSLSFSCLRNSDLFFHLLYTCDIFLHCCYFLHTNKMQFLHRNFILKILSFVSVPYHWEIFRVWPFRSFSYFSCLFFFFLATFLLIFPPDALRRTVLWISNDPFLFSCFKWHSLPLLLST